MNPVCIVWLSVGFELEVGDEKFDVMGKPIWSLQDNFCFNSVRLENEHIPFDHNPPYLDLEYNVEQSIEQSQDNLILPYDPVVY